MEVVAFVLLAEEGFTGFHGTSLAVLAAAIAAAAFWFLFFASRWLATRPRMPEAGIETREVGPEPPAIVNLLVHGWEVTRASIQATMLDLASRKYLAIDMYGDEQFVVRLRRDPPQEKLAKHEQQVLTLVQQKAVDGSAPAEALTLGTEKEAEDWWKRFRKSVAESAKGAGLARNRWAPSDLSTLGAGLAVVIGLFALAFGMTHVGGLDSTGERRLDPEDWLWVGFFAWILTLAVISQFRDLRDTPAGREACARWLGVRNYLGEINAFDDVPAAAVIIWERYLAYGVAMGVAKDATRQLPLAPDDPDTAWSKASGSWREIRVSYPDSFGFGGWPFGVFAGGLARVIGYGAIVFAIAPIIADAGWDVVQDAVNDGASSDTTLIGAAFVAIFVIVCWYPFTQFINGLIRMFLGASDMFSKPLVVEGTVVKVYAGRVAVDDGKVAVARSWTPPPGSPPFAVGSRIRATMSPAVGHVKLVEVLAG